VSEGGLALPAMPSAPHGGGARTGREPWMMNAAQNLVRHLFFGVYFYLGAKVIIFRV